jgi:putative ABC transport system substrate-binding protein
MPTPEVWGNAMREFIGRNGRVVAGCLIMPRVPLRCVVAAIVLLASPLTAQESRLNKIPRLCFVTFDPDSSRSTRFSPFFEELGKFGYADGQSIAIDFLSANGQGELFPSLAADCVHRNANIIAVSSTPAALAAKNATGSIPIVMIAVGDPVGTGLVDSLAQPGGNITGMSQMVSELAVKRLELLKEIVPNLTRVLVVTYLTDPIAPLQVKALKKAAPSVGVTLHVEDIKNPDDLSAAFDAGSKEHVEGVLVTNESIFVVHRARVSDLASRHGLPAIYTHSIQVTDGGGLIAYDVIDPDLQRHAAAYVDRILKGTKPSDLPVQQPSKFELVVNLRAARTLGIVIPASLLARADNVIE